MKTEASILAAALLVVVPPFVGRAGAQEPPTAGDDVVVIDATRGRALDASQTMRVRVRNTLVPARSVVISIINPTAPEYVLGVVPAGASREFVIDTRHYVGGVRLLAEAGPRARLVNGVQAVSQSRATWDLGINFMRFERLEAPAEAGDRVDG